MYLLVMYDIVDNSTRTRVSEALLDEGLERIQYSVFLGHAGRVHRQRIMALMRRKLGDQVGVIHIIPLHQDNVSQAEILFNPRALP